MAAPAVKALLFDVFGTVVDWRSGVARAAREAAAGYSLAGDWEAFADTWRALYQPKLDEVRSGGRPWLKLDVLHREALAEVAPRFGLNRMGTAELDELNLAWHALDPWPDSIEGLTRLRRRFVLAPVSNGNISLIVDMARRAGLPWDAILGAETARAYKPQPAVYLSAAEMLSLAPAECLMVAAHVYDLEAARALGLRTAFVRRPLEYGPARPADDPAGHDFDLVVSDLVELAAVLDC